MGFQTELTLVRHQELVLLDANAQLVLQTSVLEERLAEAKKDSHKAQRELESLRFRFAVMQSELAILKPVKSHKQIKLLPPQKPQRRSSPKIRYTAVHEACKAVQLELSTSNHQQMNLLPPQQPQRRPSSDIDNLALQQIAAKILEEQQHAISKAEIDQLKYEYCLFQ